MNSSNLKKFFNEFSDWYPLAHPRAPPQKGAYIIRKAGGKAFGRLRGKSDILYIGKSEGKGGLKRRLSFYLRPGKTQWTSRRIHEMSKKYEMEIAWCPSSEPKNLEHKLLNKYLLDHDELPPLNHAGSKTLKKVLSETIGISDSMDEKNMSCLK